MKDQNDSSIFLFHDYRDYLRAVFEKMRVDKPQFSYRYFAKKAGLGGQSYVSMVMDGKRNLTLSSIGKFAKALSLNKKESAYFEALVLYNQAKSEDEKKRYLIEVLNLRAKDQIFELTRDQFEYFTNAHLTVIREMVALKDFQNDPEWIRDNLMKVISLGDVKKALGVLVRLGLLVDGDKGLRHSGKTLQSPIAADSNEILRFHKQVLNDTQSTLSLASPGEWDVASMIIPMPKEALPQVMDILQKCREDIAALINRGNRDFHEIFQINMQLFPVTKTKKARNS